LFDFFSPPGSTFASSPRSFCCSGGVLGFRPSIVCELPDPAFFFQRCSDPHYPSNLKRRMPLRRFTLPFYSKDWDRLFVASKTPRDSCSLCPCFSVFFTVTSFVFRSSVEPVPAGIGSPRPSLTAQMRAPGFLSKRFFSPRTLMGRQAAPADDVTTRKSCLTPPPSLLMCVRALHHTTDYVMAVSCGKGANSPPL